VLGSQLQFDVSDPGVMFADAADLKPPSPARNISRREYAKLVTRQIRAGLVELSSTARAGAQLFGRSKDNGATRVIWSGAEVSASATRPPKPQDLATPDVFLDIEASAGRPLRGIKRDGAAMFDQLRLPTRLRPYLAQPPLSILDLQRYGGLTDAEAEAACPDGHPADPSERVYPLSTTWRMGFAHSSAVCQDVSLAACNRAGLTKANRLAAGLPRPLATSPVHLVATDDIVAFTDGGADEAATISKRVDAAMDSLGIARNRRKDIDGDLDMTAIGIDMSEGRYFTPSISKAMLALGGGRVLLEAERTTARNLERWLGLPHWFCQLLRPTYSVFGSVYGVTARDALDEPTILDASVRAEIGAAMALLPLIEVDACRPWSDRIVATDAAPEHGFGVMETQQSATLVRRVAREAAVHDIFVRPEEDTCLRPRIKERQGHQVHFPVGRSAFRTVVQKKADFVEHSGAMEAGAVTLACRWMARSRRHHQCRALLLVDAQAVLHAHAKGRSSAATLCRPLRRAAAVLLAIGTTPTFVYVPSESNPADLPSRGVSAPGGCSR